MSLLSSPLSHRVRSFLEVQGAPPDPRLSRNYEQIFTLFQRRREDDEFWEPLTELLRELVQSALNSKDNPSIASRSEARLLALWDVKDLAQRLRAALPLLGVEHGDGARKLTWTHLSRGLSPSTLGLFLVFGLAATACNSPEGDTVLTDAGSIGGATASGGATATGGSGNTGGTVPTTGGNTAGCQRDVSSTPPNDTGHPLPSNCCTDAATELWNAIDQSTLADTDKETLYSCLLGLNATWCDGLVQVFRTASASDIAAYLGHMLTCCRYGQGSALSGDFSQRGQALIEGMVCGVPLYKGVSFPS